MEWKIKELTLPAGNRTVAIFKQHKCILFCNSKKCGKLKVSSGELVEDYKV